MPRTISDNTGDGVSSNLVIFSAQLPDSGGSVVIGGQIQAIGQSVVQITGSPLTFPSAPGSGVINVIIQVNTTTGAASIKQNTTAGTMPVVDAGNIQIFQTVMQVSDTSLALDADNVTPDSW